MQVRLVYLPPLTNRYGLRNEVMVFPNDAKLITVLSEVDSRVSGSLLATDEQGAAVARPNITIIYNGRILRHIDGDAPLVDGDTLTIGALAVGG